MTQDSADREASEWFARLRGPDGESARAAFERWRDSDPAHAQAYADYEALWAAYGAVRRPREARPARGPHWGWPALAAASVALILLVAIGVWRFSGELASGGPLIVFDATSAKALRLDDGSVVLLAPGATVSVGYSAHLRELRLTRGEARFIVVPDAARPFRVLAGSCSVLATGTMFDVRLTGASAEVALIEGRAEVRTAKGVTVRLAAGDAIGSDGTRRPAAIAQRDTASRVSVEAMPLRDVLALANRGSPVVIALGDPEVGDRLVTGTFDLADTRALARKLAVALDLWVDERGARVVLAPAR